MNNQLRRRPALGLFEQLEDRRLLAVTATAVNGDLRIEGVADGPVAIVATGATTIQVSDNGNLIATLEGVNDDIFIKLDKSGETTNDDISLQLDGAAIDRVLINAGAGDNSVKLESGLISGSLSVVAGEGDDTVTIDASAKVARSVYAKLGDGDNFLSVNGSIANSLFYEGGLDDDTLSMPAGSVVGGGVMAMLGDGNNQVSIEGAVEKSVMIRSGLGDDSLMIGETGVVSGSVLANLGAGSNAVTHSGEISRDLRVRTATTTDTVTVNEEAIVGGKTVTDLGTRLGHHGRGRFGR